MSEDHGPTGEAEPESVSTRGPTAEISEGILELDHVYEALGHPRRRYLCYTFLEDTQWSLTDLAQKIAAWEHDVPEDEITGSHWQPVYVSLYHAHVPKLVDEGVVLFDDSTEQIIPGEHLEQVLAALEGMGASVDVQQEEHARRGRDFHE